MKNFYSKAILSGFAMVVFSTAVFAQTTAFSYQGHLNNGAAPANGNYEMEFKLFDALAGGAQVGASVTDASVVVINGVFVSTLDFTAVPFDGGAARYLEIAVRPAGNPNPFTILTPRQQVKSTPFAIHAKNAATAVTATNALQLGGVAASEYVTTTSVGNSFIKNGTVVQTGDFNISGNGTVGGFLTAQTATGHYGVKHTDGATTLGTFIGSGAGAIGGWFGTQSVSPLNFFTSNGPARMTIDALGNVGIGTPTPTAGVRLDVNGSTRFTPGGTGGSVSIGAPNGETGMIILGTNRADVRFDGGTLKLLVGTGVTPPTNGLIVNTLGNVATSGNFGVGTFSPETRLTLNGGPAWTSNGWTASMNLRNGAAIGWDANASGRRFGIGQSTAGLYFFRSFSSFGNGASPADYAMIITDSGNIGIGTINPTQKLEVAGTTKTGILEITGGSDLAENFEFTEAVRPGLVVTIDPFKTGKLTIARGAYNRRVAGVISGANDLAAGMVLPDLKNNENSMPVALSGRVWVFADATNNPIQAGDLLTTSATPGHAMKVTNFRRAQGAIIGKAMTELRSGQGLVLVLVTLQ